MPKVRPTKNSFQTALGGFTPLSTEETETNEPNSSSQPFASSYLTMSEESRVTSVAPIASSFIINPETATLDPLTPISCGTITSDLQLLNAFNSGLDSTDLFPNTPRSGTSQVGYYLLI